MMPSSAPANVMIAQAIVSIAADDTWLASSVEIVYGHFALLRQSLIMGFFSITSDDPCQRNIRCCEDDATNNRRQPSDNTKLGEHRQKSTPGRY